MIARRMVAAVAQRQVRYVTPVPAGAAEGPVARVYDQVVEEMGLVIPPVLVHSPAPTTLAAFWALFRESLIASGDVDRAAKETVAAAIGVATTCPYCVDMHSVAMYELATEEDAEAVVADRSADLADGRLRALVRWAATAHLDARTALPAQLTTAGRAELLAVLVSMHYLTRVVNVFLPGFLLPSGLTPRARRRFKRGVAQLMRSLLHRYNAPGRALGRRTSRSAGVPPTWAAAVPPLAAAYTGAAEAFEEAGARSLSPAVRRLLWDRLAGWDGSDPGLDTRWCERLVAGLPEPERAAGRLVLLTAIASYRVDAEVVAGFRRHHPDDVTLVEAVAWAAFTTARVIAERQDAAGAQRTAGDAFGNRPVPR